MITLTTVPAGSASNTSIDLKAGVRYAFEWAKAVTGGPVAGTLTVFSFWDAGNTAQLPFREADGTAISYDLASVGSGGFEFATSLDGKFHIALTGAGSGTIVHFSVRSIKV